MSVDLQLPLREAIVSFLRGYEPLTMYVDERIYGEKQPSDVQWPFVRYGYTSGNPFKAQCIDGQTVDVALHVFAQGPSTDQAWRIVRALSSLDEQSVQLDDGWLLDLNVIQSQVIPEGTDAYHGIVRFSALVGIED